MFCSNCGNQLGEQDKFCAACGAPVRRESGNFVKTTEESPVSRPERTEEKKKTIGLIVAISALALIVLLMLFVFVSVSGKRAERTFEKYKSEYETEWEDDSPDEPWEFDGGSLF